jgi:hypothetical protein
MALNTQLSDAAANAACNAVTALANSGSIKLYATAQPANGNTATSGQTLLATLALSATAFAGASGGVAAANTITSATAVGTATATWFRVLKNDGTTVVFDGSVGTSTSNLIMNSTAIQSGSTVAISALSFSIVEAGS